MTSTSRRSGPGELEASAVNSGGEHNGAVANRQDQGADVQAQKGRIRAAPMLARKRRRRQRSQRGKRRRMPYAGPGPTYTLSREHIFQDIEGLLRQIREQAEESPDWTEQQLDQITQTVTAFTKSLEEEADPISDRARSEYQRIRDKLSNAMKGA
jgi:hypothetical protein